MEKKGVGEGRGREGKTGQKQMMSTNPTAFASPYKIGFAFGTRELF